MASASSRGDATGDAPQARPQEALPPWLLASERYAPPADHDGFIARSALAITSTLSRLRLDDGQRTAISPSAPIKLLLGLVIILLTSLSRNFAFVLLVLAGTLARVAALPASAVRRIATVASSTAGLTALVMLPATFLGQPQSALLVATKVLVSVGIALTVALSTPTHELTGALRALHVPNLAIMTVDLALKGIVDLGTVALEVLQALRLRSVGRNRTKGGSLGSVGGVVLLKANKAAQDTSDAMSCRGFEGEYAPTPIMRPRPPDLAWLAGLVALFAVFLYLQGQV